MPSALALSIGDNEVREEEEETRCPQMRRFYGCGYLLRTDDLCG